MGEPIDKPEKEPVKWILMVSLSPLVCLVSTLKALYSLLRYLCKVALLVIIVAMTSPFAVMYNLSVLGCKYNNLAKSQKFKTRWDFRDARLNIAIEIKLFVSDFLKQVAGELLLVVSTGIITFYTAPLIVFCISTAVWIVAILHKWLNIDCISRSAVSRFCDGHGLSPLTFLCSFIGLFDIGCHPVAKCTFAAHRAFLFVEDEEKGDSQVHEKDGQKKSIGPYYFKENGKNEMKSPTSIEEDEGDKLQCSGTPTHKVKEDIKFSKWNAFDIDLFQLNPKIEFTTMPGRHYILKSCMVLKLFGKKVCEYPVETLELPEDYSRAINLKNFLFSLSIEDGFVTNKMRGQYEHTLTLSQIVEGVEKYIGYEIIDPIDNVFVVVGCSKSQT